MQADDQHREAGDLLVERRALRAIALFEAFKGVVAFAAIIGVIDLMHHDVRRLAMALIGHFNLDPESHFPSVLLHYADLLPGADIRTLLALATGYILVRFVEAYGLWTVKTWGEYLGAFSGGLYIPFEIIHLIHRPSLINVAVMLANSGIVCFLVFQILIQRRRHPLR